MALSGCRSLPPRGPHPAAAPICPALTRALLTYGRVLRPLILPELCPHMLTFLPGLASSGCSRPLRALAGTRYPSRPGRLLSGCGVRGSVGRCAILITAVATLFGRCCAVIIALTAFVRAPSSNAVSGRYMCPVIGGAPRLMELSIRDYRRGRPGQLLEKDEYFVCCKVVQSGIAQFFCLHLVACVVFH